MKKIIFMVVVAFMLSLFAAGCNTVNEGVKSVHDGIQNVNQSIQDVNQSIQDASKKLSPDGENNPVEEGAAADGQETDGENGEE